MTAALQSHPGQARYAARRATYFCVLLDVRCQTRPASLQVWSKPKRMIVNLPRKDRDGFPIIEIISRDFKRWAAVDLPQWLIKRERLEDDGSESGDDSEWRLAKYEVDYANKYRRLPGKSWGFTRSDYASGRAFE